HRRACIRRSRCARRHQHHRRRAPSDARAPRAHRPRGGTRVARGAGPVMSRATLDLGIIGNGSVSALIDGGGRIVWCCLPTFDADPVFCDLLSPELDGGYFDVELHEEKSRSQRYLDNTAILVTRLEANDGGMLEITDFAPRYKQ